MNKATRYTPENEYSMRLAKESEQVDIYVRELDYNNLRAETLQEARETVRGMIPKFLEIDDQYEQACLDVIDKLKTP